MNCSSCKWQFPPHELQSGLCHPCTAQALANAREEIARLKNLLDRPQDTPEEDASTDQAMGDILCESILSHPALCEWDNIAEVPRRAWIKAARTMR